MAQAVEEKKVEAKDAKINVLMVLTNCNAVTDKEGKVLGQTGWYLPEAAHPYESFIAAGYGITFASIKGGECECDWSSIQETILCDKPDKACVEFLDLIRASDANEMKRDDAPKCKAVDHMKGSIGRDETGDAKDRKLNKVMLDSASFTSLQGQEADFDIVFFTGGHGTCFDFYDSNPKHDKASTKDTRDMHAFAAKVYENKEKPGVVAAVCHGPLALVDLALSDGTMLVKDKEVCGFSNKEEDAAKMSAVVPQSLQDGLIRSGGKYKEGAIFTVFAVADQGVVTGQNPMSAGKAGKLCIEELAKIRAAKK